MQIQGAGRETSTDAAPIPQSDSYMLVHRWSRIRGSVGARVTAGNVAALFRPSWWDISYGWWSERSDQGSSSNPPLPTQGREGADDGGGLRTGWDGKDHPKLVVQAANGKAPTRIALDRFRDSSKTTTGIIICIAIATATIWDRYRHLSHEEWRSVGITLLIVFFASLTTGYLAGRAVREVETIE